MLWGLVTWPSLFGNEELPQNVNHEVNTTLHNLQMFVLPSPVLSMLRMHQKIVVSCYPLLELPHY